jgi:hypothetical protein
MKPTSRWRVALNMRLLTDLQRENLLAGIQKVAGQSALVQLPAVAASLAALATKGATLSTNVAVAAASEAQFKNTVVVRDASRVSFDLELDTLKTLAENNATDAADLTGIGFVPLNVSKASRTVPDAPAAVIVKTGKTHGKARVAVQGKGNLGSFVAEVSTDPIGPATWTSLPGNGKQRTLSGYPTGTKLWVHFAKVRWGLQSAWSVPVLVTIP